METLYKVTTTNGITMKTILLFIGLFVSHSPLPAQSVDLRPSLHVSGQSQLMVAPDQVSVVMGLTTQAETVRGALNENSSMMDAIFDSMESLGLDREKNLKTQNFSVNPMWSNRPRSASADWKQEIIGYRVNNSIVVTSKELELIGDIIAKGTEHGANQINSVTFSIADKRKHRTEAITEATKNAYEDAKALAAASGSEIHGVRTITIDQFRSNPVVMQGGRFAAMAEDSIAAPPIQSGDIGVQVSVSIVYNLK